MLEVNEVTTDLVAYTPFVKTDNHKITEILSKIVAVVNSDTYILKTLNKDDAYNYECTESFVIESKDKNLKIRVSLDTAKK